MSEALDDIVLQMEEEAATLPKKNNQCIQHLIELGYLPLLLTNALSPGDIQNAKLAFLEEAVESGLFPMVELQLLGDETDDEFLARLLERATDIDEGFRFSKLPDAGEVSLTSRIVHYRLDIFGLLPFAISQPFDVINSQARLQELGDFLQRDKLAALNLAGDVEKMTTHLLEIHPDEDFILAFKPRNTVEPKLKRQLNRTQKFKKQLIEDFGEKTEFFRYLRKEILKEKPKKVDFNFLNLQIQKPFKKFIMRLIQVHQWQDGLYNGLLDSDMGELTINSILKTNELYNSANDKRVPSFRILTHLVDDYFLFNALFFLQEYMVEEEKTDHPEDRILNDLMHNITQASDGELNAFDLHMNVIKGEIATASENKPVERKGFLQRVYYGVKKIFSKIAKFSRKIFVWVVRFADQFKEILKKVFGGFFDSLSTGIRAFIAGIKTILGRGGIISSSENGMIASVIRLDGDCYNFVTGNKSITLVDTHIKSVDTQVKNLRFSLAIVGGVLKIVATSLSVFSWPMLMMTIVKTAKQITETYRNLNIVTN
jgi:hypothetical protein